MAATSLSFGARSDCIVCVIDLRICTSNCAGTCAGGDNTFCVEEPYWPEEFRAAVASKFSVTAVDNDLGPWSLIFAIPTCWLMIQSYRAENGRLEPARLRKVS